VALAFTKEDMPDFAPSTAEVDGIDSKAEEDRIVIAPAAPPNKDYDDDNDCISCRTDGTTVKASNSRRRITVRTVTGNRCLSLLIVPAINLT